MLSSPPVRLCFRSTGGAADRGNLPISFLCKAVITANDKGDGGPHRGYAALICPFVTEESRIHFEGC